MLQPGQTFGRYTIEDLLGEGGMGKVYRALDNELHRRVALKVLQVSGATGTQPEEAKARMLREARAAAALEHPNVVSIYDLGSIDGTPFIAMELVKGKSLHAYVGDASVPWNKKLRWLLDAATALGAAHTAGLVHRDVKPDNVMVCSDGRIKVLDFGIARRATIPTGTGATVPQGAASDTSTLTGEGVAVGTLRYMPPEQLAGRPLDGRADQFAWAVTAYELFAGEPPWPERGDLLASLTAILTTPAPPLSERAPELPPAVVEAIHRALSKAPDERFPSMNELVATLRPYAAPSTSVPPADTPSVARIQVVPEASSRRPVDVHGVTTKNAAVDSLRGSRSRRRWLATAGVAAVLALASGAGFFVSAARNRVHGAAASATPSTSASVPAPVTLLDLPMPSSTVPEALVAYRAGLQARHDANYAVAASSLLEAATKDPGMGAAHLRYAMNNLFIRPADAHAHYLKAEGLRSTLSAHDVTLLDATAPIFDQQPPNWKEAERKLQDACAQNPSDAELLYTLANTRSQLGKDTEALAAANASLAIDPHFAPVLLIKMQLLSRQGDTDGVIRAAGECLESSPQASVCVRVRMRAESEIGRCGEYEKDARQLIAINAKDPDAYEALGNAALVEGRSLDSVLQTYEVGWQYAGDDAPWVEASDAANVYAMTGGTSQLEKELGALDRIAAQKNDAYEHTNAAWLRVEERTELGALDAAAHAARDFLERRSVWQTLPDLDAQGIAFDMVPMMTKALARAGTITPVEFGRRRDEWIATWQKRIGPDMAGYLWMFGYAQTVDTPAEAAEALMALADYPALPAVRFQFIADASIGHTYLLGGRVADAIPLLQRAASRCDATEDSFAYVHASLWLGEAFEVQGRKDEACAAYARVIARWSGFGVRSVSLHEARARSTALACPPSN